MYLVVDFDYILWEWPVFVLTLNKFKCNTSLGKWVTYVIHKLVRLSGICRGSPIFVSLIRDVIKHLVVAFLSNTPTNDIEPTAAFEPKFILLFVLKHFEVNSFRYSL